MYKQDEYCMNFTNKEIVEYLVDPLKKYHQLSIRMLSFAEEDITSNPVKDIKWISFDGHKENFIVSFYGTQTSIFIANEVAFYNNTFNEEFMFIDDSIKENITSNHTYHNVVYEGELRNKTHKEILELISEFITILIGVTQISIEETVISQIGWQYPKCSYKIKLTNDTGIKGDIQFENIQFLINQ